MSSSPIRRAHLVSPFGVGALLVAPDGTSMICGGLDHWFDGAEELGVNGDLSEYQFSEWRLQDRLGVSHFRLPPDYRAPSRRGSGPAKNSGLIVPFLRFPTWHVCPSPGCRTLVDLGSFVEGVRACDRCRREAGRRVVLTQVPFVAMCDAGHLADFPWREWVHRSASPDCAGRLTLRSRGGTTLAGQVVACECGATRNLNGITEASPDGDETRLSATLSSTSGEPFLCSGKSPQHGPDMRVECVHPIRASLRAASNLYFGDVVTSIFLPERQSAARPEIVELLRHPSKLNLLVLYRDSGQVGIGEALRQNVTELMPYSSAEVDEAVSVVLAGVATTAPPNGIDLANLDLRFRMDEARLIREPIDHDRLLVRSAPVSDFTWATPGAFSRISLVDRLCETRALADFTRVFPDQGRGRSERLATLWRSPPGPSEVWLPAYQVFGEGIYLELDEERLSRWEKQPVVARRVAIMQKHADSAAERRKRDLVPLPPRYVLAHTLAHLLMNQLTFECGYSTAALRERLYVSADPSSRLAGILIYTAAGDAEGTMGGLVRMGTPGRLEPTIERAISSAEWCAADPVCMEIGAQGPDSCNLAACHSCCLVPETACEQFNRFLDRALLVGLPDKPKLGYFRAG